MGVPVATNLLRAGYALTVYDVREAGMAQVVGEGAKRASSPADVAAASDVIMTSLPGPREVEAVATGHAGIIHGIRAGSVYVDLSTNAPTLIRNLHRRFGEVGAEVLDAPLGGRSPLAWERKLTVMVGGDRATFERLRPLFEAIGERVIYCGASGSGMICKLMHNCINAVFRQATAECFTAGVKAGVDAEVLWEITRNGITAGGSDINRTMRQTWLRGDFDTGTGSLDSHTKDTDLAVQLGHAFEVPMELAELTLERLNTARGRGWGRRDSTVSLLLQEERAGVEVRIPDA